MLLLNLWEVVLRPALADGEVGVLGEEAEVGDCVDLAARVPGVVQDGLGEDVVHLEAGEVAEQVAVQGEAAAEVAGAVHPGEHVQQRVEARASPEPLEVLTVDGQVPAAPPFERGDEPVDAGPGRRVVVLVEHGFGRAGEPAPQGGVDVPEQRAISCPPSRRSDRLTRCRSREITGKAYLPMSTRS